eukprot:4624777-Pyramimonas_sp.AAC.1
MDTSWVWSDGPKSLDPGATQNSTFYLPMVPLDISVYRMHIKLDYTEAALETNETNVWTLEWKLCWPPDLVPGPNISLAPPPAGGPRGVLPAISTPGGGELCITPDYMQVRGPDHNLSDNRLLLVPRSKNQSTSDDITI